ncbi:hypothetical protein [Polaromonas sp. SM01]|uniref:hypothetical protein n=1 Tax=Polaromonas sp. SM01 TaxID=3085630 RepID=UPI0029827A43|nr:hypothetical protein [Polaromonas sp. SM01]MDW5444026.1 hypothetical protein [Polaromonas sp. SM01]
MNAISRTLLTISASLVLILLVLKIGWPDQVVNQRAGYALSIGWAFMLFLGLGLRKDLNLGTGSAGIALVYFSTGVVAGTTNFFLRLGFFDTAPTKQTIEVFCITTTLFVFFAWWKILRRGSRR